MSIGIQLLSLGILAELVTAYNIRPEDTYSVVESIPTREDRPRRRERGSARTCHERRSRIDAHRRRGASTPIRHEANRSRRTQPPLKRRGEASSTPRRRATRGGSRRWSSSRRRRDRRRAYPAPAGVHDGQRHLPMVHRLEPARARHLRHRRVPLADRHPGQDRAAAEDAPVRQPGQEAVKHFYSSKPALLST